MPGGLRRGSVGDPRVSVVSLRRGGVQCELWPHLGTVRWSGGLGRGMADCSLWLGWGLGEGVVASRALPS